MGRCGEGGGKQCIDWTEVEAAGVVQMWRGRRAAVQRISRAEEEAVDMRA
jgi:hypothetical protein